MNVSIPSTLACAIPIVRSLDSAAVQRERRLRAAGFEITPCPRCGQTATREVCTVRRGRRSMKHLVLRCWGEPRQGLIPGPGRCPAAVFDVRQCACCGDHLEAGAHPRRRHCLSCREVLVVGISSGQRRRILEARGAFPEGCPCGCGLPVRPGNVYAAQGCSGRSRYVPPPPSASPRVYVCGACRGEHVHQGRGSVPALCRGCRLEQIRERKRQERALCVRVGYCVDCGSEVRQEGRGGMPMRCPACAQARIVEQRRDYSRRRQAARRQA